MHNNPTRRFSSAFLASPLLTYSFKQQHLKHEQNACKFTCTCEFEYNIPWSLSNRILHSEDSGLPLCLWLIPSYCLIYTYICIHHLPSLTYRLSLYYLAESRSYQTKSTSSLLWEQWRYFSKEYLYGVHFLWIFSTDNI